MYIKRSMENFIQNAGNSFKAILVTGARQVGKSTLLHHLFPERHYLTFDDPILLEEAGREPGFSFAITPCLSHWMKCNTSSTYFPISR